MDLASKHDLTALVPVFHSQHGIFFKPHIFCPRSKIYEMSEEENIPFEEWNEQGHLEQSGFEVVEYEDVWERLEEIEERYKIKSVVYDPWEAEMISQRIRRDKRYEAVKMDQTIKHLAPPTSFLYKLIMQGNIHHPLNPCMTWQLNNMIVYEDNNENMRPKKKKSEGKIDAVVALLMGLDQARRQRGKPEKSVYAERGMRTI